MKQKHEDYQLVPFPRIRRIYLDVLCEGQRKHMIHALLEVDAKRRLLQLGNMAKYSRRYGDPAGSWVVGRAQTTAGQHGQSRPGHLG